MSRKTLLLNLIVMLTLVLSACGAPATVSRTASFTEIQDTVQMRLSAEGDFAPAGMDQQLQTGAQVQTDETGKARLAIQPDETFVYVGPNTLFTLTGLAAQDDAAGTNRLKLDFGQLWIVLGGGSLDVETPSGVASVRGSYMGVGYTPGGDLVVTCLEGHCNLTNNGGSTDLTDGEACDVSDTTDPCNERDMNDDEEDQWEENVPGSDEFIPTETPTPTPTATFTPTPQSTSEGGLMGPELDDFPPGINPLTGLPVDDLSTLDLPAIMLSIPLFPASGRPLAGVGSSPWIFEIYIGEGMTRLLATFYGDLPTVQRNPTGSCEVRTEPFVAGEFVLGNRAWIDQNSDGIQQSSELGIGGICVTLYDAAGTSLQTTATDSNGYYGFNVDPGQEFVIGFERSESLELTTQDVGLDDQDSDADPATGLTPAIAFGATDMNWDAGYVPGPQTDQTPEPGDGGNGGYEGDNGLPSPEVGPVRSMRLPYGRIGSFFQGGCIVSASGDPSVLAQVPGCRYVQGDDSNDINSALLSITDLHDLAVQNQKPYQINYAGNIFNMTPPAGGLPASQVEVIWNWGNRSQYVFDPLSNAYLRYADLPDTPLDFYPQTDRLNGRQLMYSNVIVMYVEHIYHAETKIDINLTVGLMGRADLFRDGRLYRIYWSTVADAYQQETQRLRPVRFTDINGNAFPLRPGNTWVNVFTPGSAVYEKTAGSGEWTADFGAPTGP